MAAPSPVLRWLLPAAITIELIALSATVWGWWLLQARAEKEDQIHFDALVHDAKAAIEIRLRGYENALWGCAGLFNARHEVKRHEWDAYVATLRPAEKLPGMLGIGFIERVPPGGMQAYLDQQRADGAQITPKRVPQGDVEAEDQLMISYVVPVSANKAAIGLDTGSERNRRRALETAAQEERAIITNIIQLVQDAKKTPGFLLVVPVTNDRMRPDRRWVYAPMIGNQVFAEVLGPNAGELAFAIADGDWADPSARITSSNQYDETQHSPWDREESMPYAGQVWKVRWQATRNFQSVGKGQSTLLLLSGLTLSSLLMLVLHRIHRSHNQAIALALRNESLRRSAETQLSETLGQAGLACWSVQADGSLPGATGPLAQRLGINCDNWITLLDPLAQASFRKAIADLRFGQLHTQLRLPAKDGQSVTLLCHGARSEDGQLLGTMADISDMVAIQERLAQSQHEAQAARERAEVAARVKADFLATMSHEIRTPLNGVIGMASLLSKSKLDGEQREFAETIRSSGETLLALINDILDFSKIEAGRLQIEQIPFSLPRLLDEVVALFTETARSKGIDLRLQLGEDLPRHYLGDPIRLRQIFLNLISNAVKFTSEGGVFISVTVLKPGNPTELSIAVRDTGIGMSKEHLAHLGEPFQQAEASTARRYGGTGLGMSICMRLLQLMHGELQMISAPQAGTTATVRLLLPLCEHQTSRPRPALQLEDPEAGTLCVLVADDHPVNQRLVQHFLKRTANRVVLAHNGAEACARFEEERFDVVLMDCQMPEVDGYDATRRIRALESNDQRQRTPIIALTANALPGDREACLAAGMDDYICKPLREGDLFAAFERCGVLIAKAATLPKPDRWTGSNTHQA